jgi:hypothetical protein
MIQTMTPQIHASIVGGDMVGAGMAGKDMAGEDIMAGKYFVLRGTMVLNIQEISKGTVE